MASVNNIHRRVTICGWRARVNTLWHWVYCAVTLAVHGYLLYRAVTRCKDYNELPWRTEHKPVAELYLHISLIVLSVMCLPFFLITAIFKTSNYAGDGIRLGRDNIHQRELADAAAVVAAGSEGASPAATDGDELRPGDEGFLRTLWRHAGPFSHGFHVVSAFSLLIPNVLLQAQEIKYGFRVPESAWQTDLDWLFGRASYEPQQSSGNTQPQYTSTVITSPHSPERLPEYSPDGGSEPGDASTLSLPEVVSPEYINYVTALAFYCVRYAAVFWYTNTSFSLVFLAQLLVIAFHFAVSFCGFAVLYKFQANRMMFADLRLVLPPVATLAVYLIGNVMMLASPVAVFSYGFQFYSDTWRRFLERYAPSYWKRRQASAQSVGYSAHVSASLMLLCVILCRGAIVYDYVIVYRKTGFPVVLACIVADAFYMVTWISTWFAFTLKQSWDFHITLARYVIASPTEGAHSAGDAQQDASSAHVVASSDGDDVTRSDSLPNSSVLRKSKPKRGSVAQRVKFDRSVDNDDNGDVTEADVTSKRDHEPASLATRNKMTNGNLRRANSDSVSRDGVSGHDRTSDDYVTQSTPESTLTRSYRHSIRDQCGLYFRMSRDMTTAPAAHSSPVPFGDREDRKSAEILLNPLRAGLSNHVTGENAPAGSGCSRPEGATGTGVQLRRGNADRKCYPTGKDSRYSYPMTASHPQNWLYAKQTGAPPPAYVTRGDTRTRHSVHVDGATAPPTDGHVVDQRRPIPWSPDTPTRASLPEEGERTPTPPPRIRKKSLDKNIYRNRDLKIIAKTSDKDSALPSSNETSSSDSNDVLCSQV